MPCPERLVFHRTADLESGSQGRESSLRESQCRRREAGSRGILSTDIPQGDSHLPRSSRHPAPVSASAESEDPEVGPETRPAKAQLGQQDNFLSDELVPKYYTSSRSTGLP